MNENWQQREAAIRAEYARAKSKFYKSPVFAAQAGIVVGVLGTLFLQWVF